MANVRQGYFDDYTQKDQKVGIGTSTSQEKLQVVGDVMSTGLSATGIATLTSASGFIERNLEYVENVDIDAGDSATLSGEIIVGAGLTTVVGTAATAGQGNIDSLKVYSMFQPPTGGTNQRPVGKPGSLFYNTDFKTVEFFDGNSWRQVDNTTTRGRAVFGGGNTPSKVSTIDFVTISSLGNAVHFGEMSTDMNQAAGSASETRGLLSGGYDGSSRSDNNDYITIAAGGNAIDFGNLSAGRSHPGACNSSTRSLVIAGYTGSRVNTIDYVEINTLGNSIDFGDSISSRDELCALSSPTRGLSAAGGLSGGKEKIIDFVTIASKGNATKFGDLTVASAYACGGGNGIRGIIMPGNTPSPSGTDPTSIDQITIASEGNAVDFGGKAISIGTQRGGSGCSKTRMVFGSGANPSVNNALEFIVISSNGSAQEFGDLTLARSSPAGLSDSNGGLGGF